METIYDLIIVGSGPAGLCAAIYAQRAKLSCITIERNYMSGGQVINTYEVDNYPGLPGINGFDMAQQFRAHAEKLGAEFVEAEVENIELLENGVKKIVADGKDYYAKTIIIATGAKHRTLSVKGEEELSGMGVSYCATCDGAFFKNKTAAVVGGGDVAVEDALFLARACEKVYLIHRRDELRAAKVLQEAALSNEKIVPVWNSMVTEITGEDKVESIKLQNVTTKEEQVLSVEGVFVAVGILPNTELFQEILTLDESGYIRAGEDCKTSVEGIFAAGDVRTKPLRQIITAAADGANAVTAVTEYLIQNSAKVDKNRGI
ncbi:MAG: thioredoxin-disulfide reductase [Lachnospiraceae bacterium]|nr:thioredoxin-disulfide reductase [Lachnospiraceae bacterium]